MIGFRRVCVGGKAAAAAVITGWLVALPRAVWQSKREKSRRTVW